MVISLRRLTQILLPNRTDDVWKDWKNKMMAAAQQCASKGVDMGVYQKRLDELFRSEMDWKEILRQFLTPMFDSTRKWLPLIDAMYTRKCTCHL